QRRQIGISLLEQESIEATAVLDGAQGSGADAQLDRTAQSVRHQGDVDEVGEEAATGTVESVRNVVANHYALAGQFTATCHCLISCLCKGPAWRRSPLRASVVVRSRGSLEKTDPSVKQSAVSKARERLARCPAR